MTSNSVLIKTTQQITIADDNQHSCTVVPNCFMIMATFGADALKENYLTCVICDSLYQDPATLQCGHTYCRSCLTSLLKSRPDAIRNKMIPCSMRCEGTRVTNPRSPVGNWARQIRPSFMITNLMDDFKKMTVDATNMEQHTSQFSRCHEHKTELLKMICDDCDKTICSSCWRQNHQHCMSVVLLETKVEKLQEHVRNYKPILDNAIKTHKTNIDKFRSKKDAIIRSKRDTRSKIQETFKQISDVLKKKESSLLRELDTLSESEAQSNEERIQSEEKNLQVYKQRSLLIEQAEKSVLLSDMYSIYQSYISLGASQRESGIDQSTYSADTDLVYSSNCDQLIHSVNKLDFGSLNIKETQDDKKSQRESSVLTGAVCKSSNDRIIVATDAKDKHTNTSTTNVLRPQQLYVIPKTSSAKTELPVVAETIQFEHYGELIPALRDVTILNGEGRVTVVVTEYNNTCLKSFYIRNELTCHRIIRLEERPFGIAQFTENQVLVTLPSACKIVIVGVTPDLVLLYTITTKAQYVSIAKLGPSRIAAGYTGSECIDILDMDGQVMKSLSTQREAKPFSLFRFIDMLSNVNTTEWSFPAFISVNNKGNILVSNTIRKDVTCLTSEGKIMWVFTQIDGRKIDPVGIQWTQEGVLVVDKPSNKVIMLSHSGQYVKDVLTQYDGLVDPFGIFADKYNSLFVCCGCELKHFTFADHM